MFWLVADVGLFVLSGLVVLLPSAELLQLPLLVQVPEPPVPAGAPALEQMSKQKIMTVAWPVPAVEIMMGGSSGLMLQLGTCPGRSPAPRLGPAE